MNSEGNTTNPVASCEPTLSRKEFVRKVIKRGTLAGALLVVPAIVDTFIVPPKAAFAMTNTMNPMMP